MERALGSVDIPSIVILRRQGCLHATRLRAPSKMTLINESTPILHSHPMKLIKSRKTYNTGRLMQGRGHDFVCMRRMGAIRHGKFEAGQFPSQFVLMLHISRVRAIPSRSLYHQAISNAPIHAGRRTKRRISGKYPNSVTIGTGTSN